ncbi:MAG: bifunctional 4-hydroxy-2-oxoglutarate aldolase/2-dehydro-3-deoxy-phosphogluconate aldolase [Planctomycetes bacterium]|nr:bifunctional 4-hydroxy-2-oxoglutarate aldolase/2-dehydro-3-deoxy-phosphogluconate aldolase [Planctomycetota bacterium]
MARSRTAVLAALAEQRCSAILRTDDAEAVRPALEAAIAGGFRIVEVTMTTPGCLDHVRELATRSDLIVGTGTVLCVDDAKAAMAAGARFIVSPVTDPQVISFCRQHDLVSIPGTQTPTEMMHAHRAGADIVKLFPGPANGADYLRAIRGPLPFLRVFPTSGVSEDNVGDWLAAGAFGVGFVGTLFVPDDLHARRFDVIQARAARMVARAREFGRPTPPRPEAIAVS